MRTAGSRQLAGGSERGTDKAAGSWQRAAGSELGRTAGSRQLAAGGGRRAGEGKIGEEQKAGADAERRGSAMIRNYRELAVYQKAFEQAMRIFEVTKRFPADRQDAGVHDRVP